MSLADLIREKSRTHFATATPATLATHAGVKVRTVAKVATVTVATPPADLTVRCRNCEEFEPGPTHWAGGLGKCARTANGRPPVASRGIGVCFPDAPRQCPDYVETRS
jgi:hypothetical protein